MPELPPWFALQVRSAQEGKVRESLSNKGYDVLFPIYRKRVGGPHRTRNVFLPLYPGYLFCRMNTATLGKIVTTTGVIRILGVGRRPHAVPADQMEVVLRTAESDLPVRPWRYFPPGALVRIEDGPLRGLTGTLLTSEGMRNLVVRVDFLKQAATVTLENDTQVTRVLRTPGVPLADRSLTFPSSSSGGSSYV